MDCSTFNILSTRILNLESRHTIFQQWSTGCLIWGGLAPQPKLEVCPKRASRVFVPGRLDMLRQHDYLHCRLVLHLVYGVDVHRAPRTPNLEYKLTGHHCWCGWGWDIGSLWPPSPSSTPQMTVVLVTRMANALVSPETESGPSPDTTCWPSLSLKCLLPHPSLTHTGRLQLCLLSL